MDHGPSNQITGNQTAGNQAFGTHSPVTQTPGTQAPGTQTPGIPGGPAVQATGAQTLGGARPGVLSMTIREKSSLFAAYMPFLKNGGVFIPTAKTYRLGDEVFMLLTLLDEPNKIPVAGTVVWTTPASAHTNKTQGIGVQFSANESGVAARNRIEGLLGGTLKSARPTHTM